MKLVSFSTSNHVGLENLKLSISKVNGWEHIIIGQNIKWKGWITRMKAYMDFCESQPNQNEIIVFSDAYDVLCLRSSDDFLKLYETHAKGKIVIGAEIGCHPKNCVAPDQWWSQNQIPEQYEHTTEFGGVIAESPRFVNGGLVAGPVNKITHMWKWALENAFLDDQIALANYTNEHVNLIFLDINSIFFFNDYNAISKYTLTQDNSLTDKNGIKIPFFIHFHGITASNVIPFKKNLFEVGINYKQIGKQLNGDDHINAFPADSRICLAIWIERSIFYAIIFFLIIFLVMVRISKMKLKRI